MNIKGDISEYIACGGRGRGLWLLIVDYLLLPPPNCHVFVLIEGARDVLCKPTNRT